jgi:predicted DNA-binding transcriptional regulator
MPRVMAARMIQIEFQCGKRLSLAAIATRLAFLAADLSSAPWLGHSWTPL